MQFIGKIAGTLTPGCHMLVAGRIPPLPLVGRADRRQRHTIALYASKEKLAERAGIGAGMQGVDLCCCTGAGMRFLVKFCGVASMRGVDATAKVVERGRQRFDAVHTYGAEQVALAVVGAVKEGRFYILTHERIKPAIRARLEDILEERAPRNPLAL